METYCDIVKAIGAGAEKPTHIMYRANLSWTVMQGYIKDLETQGLVVSQDSDGKRLYKLTEKGFMLLKQYVSIKEYQALARRLSRYEKFPLNIMEASRNYQYQTTLNA